MNEGGQSGLTDQHKDAAILVMLCWGSARWLVLLGGDDEWW